MGTTMGRIDEDCDSFWLGLDQQIEMGHRTLWQCTSATGQPLFPSDYRTNPACDAFSGQVLQTKLNLPVPPAPFCQLPYLRTSGCLSSASALSAPMEGM